LFKRIKANSVSFQASIFDHTSEHAKDLILRMLDKSSTKRISISNALKHEFFDTPYDALDPTRHSKSKFKAIDSQVIRNLLEFKEISGLVKA